MPFDPSSAQAITGFDPGSAQIESAEPTQTSSTVPSAAQSIAQNAPASAQDNSSSIGSYAGAAVAGLANAGADIGTSIVSGATYLPTKLMQHLGIISPETADNIANSIQHAADIVRTNENTDPNDPFAKAVQDHPVLATIAKAAPDMTAATRAIGAIGPAAAKVQGLAGAASAELGLSPLWTGTAKGIAGVAARAVGQGVVGQAITDDPNQKAAAFVVNAGISPVFDAAGALVNKAVAKTQLQDKLTSLVGNVNSKLSGLFTDERAGESIANMYQLSTAAANKWYDVVRNTKFTPEDQTATYNLGRKLNDYLYTDGKTLNAEQANILQDAATRLSAAGSHDETVSLLQSMGKKASLFGGVKATDAVHDYFMGARSQLQDILNTATTREGNQAAMGRANLIWERMVRPAQDVGADDISTAISKYGLGSDEVKQATNNIINKYVNNPGAGKITQLLNSMDNRGSEIIQQHIIKSTFDKITDDPANFNYERAGGILKNYVNKYTGTLSDDSINALKGAQRILEEAGSAANKSAHGTSTYVAHAAGATAGGYIGYKTGGEGGAAVGTIAGLAGGQVLMDSVKSLLSTPQGQGILRALGEGAPSRTNIGNVIKTLSVLKLSQTANSGSQ